MLNTLTTREGLLTHNSSFDAAFIYLETQINDSKMLEILDQAHTYAKNTSGDDLVRFNNLIINISKNFSEIEPNKVRLLFELLDIYTTKKELPEALFQEVTDILIKNKGSNQPDTAGWPSGSSK